MKLRVELGLKKGEEEIEEVDEWTRKRGFFWWNTRDAERRPLLQ